MVQPVGTQRRRVQVECGCDRESCTLEPLRQTTRTGEEVRDPRTFKALNPARFLGPEGCAEIPQLTLAAQRLLRTTHLAAVHHEVDVQRVPQVRGNKIGKDTLQLLVVQRAQGES